MTAPISTSNRSAVTNGTQMLQGIDGRSPEARRYRDLCREYIAELGGDQSVTEARRALVRQAAGVAVAAEQMQAKIVRGEDIDAEQLVRLSNLQSRLLRQLGIGGSKPAAKPKSLADYLAEREVSAA